MGEPLHNEVVGENGLIKRPCRIYAPVGGHEDLLAYLVRRLLENGANTSFINRLADDEAPVSEIIRDPVGRAEAERGGTAEPLPPSCVRARSIFPSATAASGTGADRAIGAPGAVRARWAMRSTTSSRPVRSSAARRARAAMAPASSPVRTIAASASERCASRRWRRPMPRSSARRGRTRLEQAGRRPRARRCSPPRPTCSSATRRASWRSSCVRPARRWRTRRATCARPSTSCAIMRCRRAACSSGRLRFPARPASATR